MIQSKSRSHLKGPGDCLKVKRRLPEVFNSMKMNTGVYTPEFRMRFDNAANLLRGMRKTVNEDIVLFVILDAVSSDYETAVRLLECGNGVIRPRSKNCGGTPINT